MLDDRNIINQRDPKGALGLVAELYKTVAWHPEVESTDHDNREIRHVVITGMGGSGLAARMVATLTSPWLKATFELVQDYQLPGYVNHHTLVIAISHSGNTEETLSAYEQAVNRGAQVSVVAGGGELMERAMTANAIRIKVPVDLPARMSVGYHLKAILKLLMHFGLSGSHLYDEMTGSAEWLRDASMMWHPDVPVHENYAKQIALMAVGKTPVFYSGPLMASLAYKWKVNWNEYAKNVAFQSQYPEFNHHEFIGWTSHPVEKPFAVIDLWSDLESERINERIEISDKLLSGKRPRAIRVFMYGDTLLGQLLWGMFLAEATSVYVAILNNVEPISVELIDKLKKELS